MLRNNTNNNNNNNTRSRIYYHLNILSIILKLYVSAMLLLLFSFLSVFLIIKNLHNQCIMPINIYLFCTILIFFSIYILNVLQFLQVIRINYFIHKVNALLITTGIIYIVLTYPHTSISKNICEDNIVNKLSQLINYVLYLYFYFYFIYKIFMRNDEQNTDVNLDNIPTRILDVENIINDDCVICMEQYIVSQQIRILPCSHIFHKNCIDRWLIYYNNMCPLCRRSV
jgi:hypothetical protein